jgi:hypothetical protein
MKNWTRDQKIAKALEIFGKNQPAYHAEIDGTQVTIHFPHSIETIDIEKHVMMPQQEPTEPVKPVTTKPGATAHRSKK